MGVEIILRFTCDGDGCDRIYDLRVDYDEIRAGIDYKEYVPDGMVWCEYHEGYHCYNCSDRCSDPGDSEEEEKTPKIVAIVKKYAEDIIIVLYAKIFYVTIVTLKRNIKIVVQCLYATTTPVSINYKKSQFQLSLLKHKKCHSNNNYPTQLE